MNSSNEFDANFCCCFMPNFVATLNIHITYIFNDNEERIKVLKGSGDIRELFGNVQTVSFNGSTSLRISCVLNNYSNQSYSTCNHHIYVNNCHSLVATGIKNSNRPLLSSNKIERHSISMTYCIIWNIYFNCRSNVNSPHRRHNIHHGSF